MQINLQRAVWRKTELLAECPNGAGVCKWWERMCRDRKMVALHCGFFRGTHTDERGLMVRCSFKESVQALQRLNA